MWAGRDALGRGPGPPLAAASDGMRLQSRVQLLDGQLGQYLIGTPLYFSRVAPNARAYMEQGTRFELYGAPPAVRHDGQHCMLSTGNRWHAFRAAHWPHHSALAVEGDAADRPRNAKTWRGDAGRCVAAALALASCRDAPNKPGSAYCDSSKRVRPETRAALP